MHARLPLVENVRRRVEQGLSGGEILIGRPRGIWRIHLRPAIGGGEELPERHRADLGRRVLHHPAAEAVEVAEVELSVRAGGSLSPPSAADFPTGSSGFPATAAERMA